MTKYMVVGGGVLGASTAYHLAKEGVDVTIVDRNDPGQATDAAAGIICPWLSQRRNKRWYRLVKGGAKYYPELIRKLEEDGERETGYRQVGAICLHTDEKKLDQMVDRALKRRENAPEIGDVRKLSPEETQKLFPPLSAEYGSVHVSGAARVDGRALRDALLHAAERNGAKRVQGDASLIYEEKKVMGVEVAGVSYKADSVLVTAGAWSKQFLEPLGVKFLVSSQKAQIVHLHVENTGTNSWPVVMPPNNQYMLSFGGGRVVVGATHEDDAGFDYRSTVGGLHYIFEQALDVAPDLYDSTFVEVRVGFRPFTPDFLPVFGAMPGFDNVWVANGLGASGLTSGPYLGAELAKLALGKETELDPSEYDITGALSSNYGMEG